MSLAPALLPVLQATLSADAGTRRAAERELASAQAHPDFAPSILALTQDGAVTKPIRMSAALNFKNWIKANWAVSGASLCLSSRSFNFLGRNESRAGTRGSLD